MNNGNYQATAYDRVGPNGTIAALVIILLSFSQTSFSALPGLPFAENFSNDNLLVTDSASARWSEDEQSVLQAFRQSVYGGFLSGGDTTASALSSETDNSRSLAIGDIDADGDLDIVVGNDSGANFMTYYRNDGDNTPFVGLAPVHFGSFAVYTALELADVDNDGDLDLVAGLSGATDKVYLNTGDAAAP